MPQRMLMRRQGFKMPQRARRPLWHFKSHKRKMRSKSSRSPAQMPHKKLSPGLPAGATYGERNAMENIFSGDSDTQTRRTFRPNSNAKRSRAGKSHRRLKSCSDAGPDQGDMPRAESTPISCESERSILQSFFDQCLEAGMLATVDQMQEHETERPILRLDLFDVRRCPSCEVWTMQNPCGVCGA